jgi:hypothetical protein
MSILLAIGKSLKGRRSYRAASAGREQIGPIFVDWYGPEAASAASGKGAAVGERQTHTAEPFNTNLDLRLEHKLQTAMRRQRQAQP